MPVDQDLLDLSIISNLPNTVGTTDGMRKRIKSPSVYQHWYVKIRIEKAIILSVFKVCVIAT